MLSSPILMIMKPTGDCPEGDLLNYTFKHFKEHKVAGASGNFTNIQINELIAKIDAVAGKSEDSVYNKIVEYVNTNYGIVSVRENEQYKKIVEKVEGSEDKFSVAEVYDRLRGIPEPDTSNTMLRMSDEEPDPVPFIDTLRVKQFLEAKIEKFTKLLK